MHSSSNSEMKLEGTLTKCFIDSQTVFISSQCKHCICCQPVKKKSKIKVTDLKGDG